MWWGGVVNHIAMPSQISTDQEVYTQLRFYSFPFIQFRIPTYRKVLHFFHPQLILSGNAITHILRGVFKVILNLFMSIKHCTTYTQNVYFSSIPSLHTHTHQSLNIHGGFVLMIITDNKT